MNRDRRPLSLIQRKYLAYIERKDVKYSEDDFIDPPQQFQETRKTERKGFAEKEAKQQQQRYFYDYRIVTW